MKNFTLKIPVIVFLIFMLLVVSSGFMFKDPNCPVDYTGAPKALAPNLGRVRFCTSCHGDFAINSGGGSVVATGLPGTTYLPGQEYNFTVKINFPVADKSIWGFAVKAVNTVNNNVVGTFSSTNGNATVKGDVPNQTMELSHASAAITAAATNYTYINLKWTAPVSPNSNESNIRFYITGLPGDGDGGEGGDYVYTSTIDSKLGTLPITLMNFKIALQADQAISLNWQSSQEQNTSHYEVETGNNGTTWSKIATIQAAGNSTITNDYSYVDKAATNQGGHHYYRLKMMDKDGGYTYSTVQYIRIENKAFDITSLTPQPLKSGNIFSFKIVCNSNKNIAIQVTDISGRQLYMRNQLVSNGSHIINIPTDKMAHSKGMVFITFRSAGFEKTFKQLVE